MTKGGPQPHLLPFPVKRLGGSLRERGIGMVTVHKRGSPIEPGTMRRQLRLSGPTHAVVGVTRVTGKPTALACRGTADR